MRKVYASEIVTPSGRGRPLGGWTDRVKEYMCESGTTRRGVFEQGKRECLDKERGSVWTRRGVSYR